MTTAFDLLATGKLLEALISIYTTPLGVGFYFILVFLTLTMVYLKTQSIRAVGISLLLMSTLTIPFIRVGRFQGILYFLLAISIAIAIYKVFR